MGQRHRARPCRGSGRRSRPDRVTAERRQEKMQNVPISIISLSGEALQNSGYQSLTDLQYTTPGLTYDPTQGAAFQIRGVGSTSFDFSNAKSVNVVVDDVVMDAQRDLGITGLVDIERRCADGPAGHAVRQELHLGRDLDHNGQAQAERVFRQGLRQLWRAQ
jgi:hypothetical protein